MRTLKRSATTIHLWFGLTIGLVGLYMAASGAWILFRPQADAIANPAYLTISSACATPVSLDLINASAARVYSKAPVDSMWWQDDPTTSLMVRYTDDQQSYFNPCTGALLGVHSRWSGTFGFVEMLHRFRFLPVGIAEPMAGSFAVVMAVIMGGLGLFIWWPRRRSAWKASLTIDPDLKGRARTRNRHSVVGAWVSVGLIIVAGSGVALAFDAVENFLFTATLSEKIHKPEVPPAPAHTPIALEAAWQNALSALPNFPRAASVRLPTPKRASIEMYIYDRGNPNPEGRGYLYADASSGKVVQYTPYAQTPRGQRLYSWLVALHKGEVGGLVGQLLTLAAMLGILYLGYSGVSSYLQKRKSAVPPLKMRVAAVRDIAKGVKAFDLVPVDRRRLRAFSAGAHIEVHTPGGPKRQYSLCNGPAQRDSYTIAVRLEDASRGGSRAMHALSPGQELLVGGPRNHFPIHPKTGHATLIAAGIGITPMLSMARHLMARGKPFTLHYFGRDADGMAYLDVLGLGEFASCVELHIGIGRKSVPATLDHILKYRPAAGHLYTCGPDAFMGTVEDCAFHAGWPEETIHRENFGPACNLSSEPQVQIDVTLASTGRQIVVAPGQSVLQALLAANVPVSSSCEQGTCGDCALRVLDGEVDHRDSFLSDTERKQGNIMLCCVSRAKGSRLVVDIIN